MLLRNYIELAVLGAALIVFLVVFLIVRHRASVYESELGIRRKSDLRGKLD